jgi:hypothetical protein
MSKILLTISLLASTLPANAATWRCNTSWNGYQCGWFYSQQELYERGQDAAVRALEYYSRGGTRRPPANVCNAALEAGVENDILWSYGCRV